MAHSPTDKPIRDRHFTSWALLAVILFVWAGVQLLCSLLYGFTGLEEPINFSLVRSVDITIALITGLMPFILFVAWLGARRPRKGNLYEIMVPLFVIPVLMMGFCGFTTRAIWWPQELDRMTIGEHTYVLTGSEEIDLEFYELDLYECDSHGTSCRWIANADSSAYSDSYQLRFNADRNWIQLSTIDAPEGSYLEGLYRISADH